MDGTLTLQRIATALDAWFSDKIDLSDVKPPTEENLRNNFLTRALASFCITSMTGADPTVAAQSVTDGFGDGGMDAIYFDAREKTLYIVQAKWSKNASKTIEEGDCCKFIKGIEALIRDDFSGFNDRIRKRQPELKANLLERSDVRIVLVAAYTGPQDLTDPVKKSLSDFLERENNVGEQEVFILETLNLKRLYRHLTGSTSGKKIDLSIVLKDWGSMDKPYRAVYGSMKLSDIAAWSEHGKPLLARNIRFFGGMTEVNEAIQGSVLHAPEQFWYLNNGITVLCDKFQKKVINGDARDYGIFDCEGVSIVNGAQTVGVVWELQRKDPLFLAAAPAHVHVRMISLEKCPEGFEIDVTKATNTQNQIKPQDFAALDPEQQRLALDMKLDNLRYAFKSGDASPQNGEGCTIEEATVALACATNDVTLVVLAKRNLGMLWQDINNAPYKTLFNEKLSAPKMWRAVLVMREVLKRLADIDKSAFPRGDLLAIHGNRFILHRVFRDPRVSRFADPSVSIEELRASTREATDAAFPVIAALIEEKHPNAYLANLFKNTQKCKNLDWHLNNPGKVKEPEPEPEPQTPRTYLFDFLPKPEPEDENEEAT